MKNGKQYDELSNFFAAHKTEIPDDGFSQRVMQTLPNRWYFSLHYVVMTLCAVATLAVVVIFGGDFIWNVATDLIISACTFTLPSFTSLIIYGGLLALLCTVGFATYYESY